MLRYGTDHAVDHLQDGLVHREFWRLLRGFRHLAKVIDGVKFNDSIEFVEDSRAAA